LLWRLHALRLGAVPRIHILSF